MLQQFDKTACDALDRDGDDGSEEVSFENVDTGTLGQGVGCPVSLQPDT